MIVGAILALVGAGFLGWLCYRSGRSNGYWTGRHEGWKSCEDMILRRATNNDRYNKDQVWEDLIQ